MTLISTSGMPLTGGTEKSPLAPSSSSGEAWLRELERANDHQKPGTNASREQVQGRGMRSQDPPRDSRPGGALRPEWVESAQERIVKRELREQLQQARPADVDTLAAVGKPGERQGAPVAAMPARLQLTGEEEVRTSETVLYAQLQARRAWAPRNLIVAQGEEGVSISIRDHDLDGGDDSKLVRSLEQESVRAGQKLKSVTVNGRELKK